ncbi:MAG: DUF2760 domain-containing protein [Thermodesulfatator sp.]|nr:MAG: DUF2760 domain-containing protein [Thermodesulfatator sp.]
MEQKNIKATIVWLSFFIFACVNCGTGAVLYFHQELLQMWQGWVLAGAPLAGWVLFALALQSIAGEVSTAEKEAIVPEQTAEEQEAAKEEITGEPVEETAEDLYPKEVAVVQLLGLLQREGRFLDFLQEDIEPYDDAQIGAAVREVHRGCKAALNDALGLKPVLDAPEGSEVEIEEDFDPAKIRLIGNVHGNPPFHGVIRHSGWRYTKINLPKWTGKEKTDVLAPAEVEVS